VEANTTAPHPRLSGTRRCFGRTVKYRMKNSRNGIGLYRSKSMQGKVFQDFFQMCSFDKQAEWSSFFDEEQLGNPLQNSENVSYDHTYVYMTNAILLYSF
jgi:hypothetical protein